MSLLGIRKPQNKKCLPWQQTRMPVAQILEFVQHRKQIKVSGLPEVHLLHEGSCDI